MLKNARNGNIYTNYHDKAIFILNKRKKIILLNQFISRF